MLAQRIVEEQHPAPVLVSLARAGTPVGVVLRRALALRGVDAPHYSVSIVRGRGIDRRALEHIVARHGHEPLVFIDGWTGKGAIMRELREALEDVAAQGGPRIAPALGVLADTGHVCELFASRADELIPSACLNSTVSGLISRTVIRPDLLGEDAFHGVRVYREFADRDVSRRYVDTITALLPSPGPELDAAVAAARWAGRRRTAAAGRPCCRWAASTASTTSTASSRASARRRACCCGACRTPCSSRPATRPTSRTS